MNLEGLGLIANNRLHTGDIRIQVSNDFFDSYKFLVAHNLGENIGLCLSQSSDGFEAALDFVEVLRSTQRR